MVRLATHPVECLPDRFDLLIGIDWLNAHRRSMGTKGNCTKLMWLYAKRVRGCAVHEGR